MIYAVFILWCGQLNLLNVENFYKHNFLAVLENAHQLLSDCPRQLFNLVWDFRYPRGDSLLWDISKRALTKESQEH